AFRDPAVALAHLLHQLLRRGRIGARRGRAARRLAATLVAALIRGRAHRVSNLNLEVASLSRRALAIHANSSYKDIHMSNAATVQAALDVRSVSRLFKALGDPTRLRIIALLSHGELCVCHLEEALRLSQPNISRHLAILRMSGVLESRREGS